MQENYFSNIVRIISNMLIESPGLRKQDTTSHGRILSQDSFRISVLTSTIADRQQEL